MKQIIRHVALVMLILVLGVNYISGSHSPQKNQQQQQQQGFAPGTGAGTVAATTTNGEVFAAKSFPLLPEEPTCEQLRAMWIFSKRQSRAAELTNEIPTFRDPFAYNVWSPYYATAGLSGASGSRAGLDGLQMITARHQSNTRSPVFGRVVSQEPVFPPNLAGTFGMKPMGGDNGHSKSLVHYPKMSSSINLDSGKKPLLTSQMRYVGGAPANGGSNNNNALAVQGSFHKLKELIWTERAKELTQQRRLEEMAARAAVLKEIANGQNIQSPYKQQQMPLQHHSESMLMDENRSPEVDFNAGTDNVRQRFMQGNKSQQSKQSQQQQQQQQQQHEHETIESKHHQEQLQKTPLRGSNRSYVANKNRANANRQKLYYRGYGGGRGLYQRPIAAATYMLRPSSYDIDSDDKIYDNFRKESDFSESDGDSDADETEEAEEIMASKPRWRNTAGGVIRKYTKPRTGGSHFRERQRALLKQYPLDKYYQRMTRGSDFDNFDNNYNTNNQFSSLNEILRELRENYNGLNNHYEKEPKYLYNFNKPGDSEQEDGILGEDTLENDEYEEEN